MIPRLSVLVLLAACSAQAPAPNRTPEPETSRFEPTRADSIYFVLVDRFANGDAANDGNIDAKDPHAWHGGDLKGVTKHLAYIDDMGFSRVWISPVFETRDSKWKEYGAFHGYWTYDLGKVHYRFGTREDLTTLGRELQQRGMSLMLDVVLNHVGYDAPLATERKSWFHEKGPIVDWNDKNQLETHDVHTLPDLAQENPEVFDYLVERSLGWLDIPGVSGFRLDAVKHIGSAFWTRFAERAHAARRDFTLLGEVYTGTQEELAHHLRNGFDMVFDFPLHFAMVDVFCKGQSPQALAAVLSADSVYPDPTRLVTFADNHDLPRILSSCGGDDAKVRDLLAFQFTARGVPAMTYGTEIGLKGAKEPENRADMRFSSGSPIHPTHALVKRILRQRGAIRALRTGRTLPLVSTPTTFAYARVGPRRAVVITVHTGEDVDVSLGPLAAAKVVRELTTGKPADRVVAQPGTRAYVLEGDFRSVAKAREVVVRLDAKSLPEGEIRVVGSHPQLGLWNPKKGLAIGPKGSEIRLPRGATVAYKLVSLKPDGSARWEGGGNRYLFADEDTELDLKWRD